MTSGEIVIVQTDYRRVVMTQPHACYTRVWMGGAGRELGIVAAYTSRGVRVWLRETRYERGEIMIGSGDNSGGVVVGAVVCNRM